MLGDKIKILVFMKPYEDIRLFVEQNFDCRIFEGNWGDPFPKELNFNTKSFMINKGILDHHLGIPCTITEVFEADWIISWLCPWKIPKQFIDVVKGKAINFHPGPPKYPGIGCYNYAIWNQDDSYGVTVHEMNEKLDNGKILKVNTFYIKNKNHTIESLKNRTIIELKQLFYEYMDILLNKNMDINLDIKTRWEWGEYKSRKDFQEFCEYYYGQEEDYDEELIERKLRATYFKGASDGPYIEIGNKKWRLIPEEDLHE